MVGYWAFLGMFANYPIAIFQELFLKNTLVIYNLILETSSNT
jgi:hypothetical protein